ncbi:hypothetical protein GG681_09060 [Epibacterium sp. SM1969]|uniref:Uncharacterized protein n=1 Tax=Tritonibacter aquimaris TaxID=2663379 RepID=A0A844ALB5_9RHOB|nr:hypothetical protein [Tritonibacter aquimaris]MQY42790.1 hypothetical protein [Tritonibacter aquimaris]
MSLSAEISGFEWMVIASMVLVTLAALSCLYFLLKTSGRDPIIDPKLAEKFRQDAPYGKLAEVLEPSRGQSM